MKKTDQIIYNNNLKRYEMIMEFSDFLKENNYEVKYSTENEGKYIHHILEVRDNLSDHSYETIFYIRFTENYIGYVSSLADIVVEKEIRLFSLLFLFIALDDDYSLPQEPVYNSHSFDKITGTGEEVFAESKLTRLTFSFLIS